MSTIGARAAGDAALGTRERGRTAAQWYCYIVGLVLLLVGALGFISDAHFDTGTTGLQGDGFLGLEVNAWHNLVHIASGAFLLAVAPKRRTARTGAIAFGVLYAVVTVVGLIDGNDIFGLFPVNPADNVLHALLSGVALVLGFASPGDDRVTRRGERVSSPTGRTSEPARP